MDPLLKNNTSSKKRNLQSSPMGEHESDIASKTKSIDTNQSTNSCAPAVSLVVESGNDLAATVRTDWPRFLIMETNAASSLTISSLSPFAIEKGIKGLIGTANSVKKLRSGALLVEVVREAQATNLLKQTSFVNIPVTISAHRSLNTCKGVIRSAELSSMDESEIKQNLADQGVKDVKIITQKRAGQVKKTHSIILTFSNNQLPPNIKAGYMNIKVQRYIPNPLRCFNCQKYGHHQSNCKQAKTCAKCGLSDHGSDPCSRAAQCINCGGDHPAFFTTCPQWISEKEICKEKVTKDISYPEARKMVAARTSAPINNFSYAAATVGKAKMVSQSTQTDVINCQCVPEVIVNRSSETQTEFQQQAVGEKQSGKNTSSNPVEAAAIADTVNPNRQKQLGQLITSSAGNNQSKCPKQSDQVAASAGYIHPNSQKQSGETTICSDETSQSESPKQSDQAVGSAVKSQSDAPEHKKHRRSSSLDKQLPTRTKDRPQKGSIDTVQSINKFAPLEEYEMSDPPLGAPSGKISLKKIVGPH
jgi:hypothetical protein